ncbi:MAG: HupE/UreJ family protein [Undibacterium sp.]|nr:HupE/UreJ family protein [Undibacterium sp.]
MQTSTSKQTARFLILTGLMSVAFPALAHVDASHAVSGFGSGFMHPLLGLDHLLAMLAVGIWAAQNQRPALWLLPLVFPLMMVFGAALGINGVHLAGIELGIAISLAVLGLLIAFTIKMPVGVSCALVALFAVVHGYAHGVELPTADSAVLYGAGFILSTALIHVFGISLSRWGNKNITSSASRFSGAGIAAMGLTFIFFA